MKGTLKHQDIFKIIQKGFEADAVLQGVPLVTYEDPSFKGALVLFEAQKISNDLFYLKLDVKSLYMGKLEKISIQQSIQSLLVENFFEMKNYELGFKEILDKSKEILCYKVKIFQKGNELL